ncbi:MarR family transcriptional regulator [Streptomyces sp. NRRL B-24484]|uniref:MarR family transcriptional regulator n=1 Tax=Streptomyces sp. NRRL B-24484 TaxID=1463833 RepID=UPI000A46D46A|nr:MarR family transcriptional regulator [Streptomyces sp. NRRL B-24484]
MTAPRATGGAALPAVVRTDAAGRLATALAATPGGRPSGTLTVLGDPGGVFHLASGVVTAVDSPGAPDVATLLLRSGRVSTTDWEAACRAGAAGERTGAELVARDLLGAAELQLMCTMAALDGAFAVAAGRVDGCTLAGGPARHHLPAPQGVDPEWLLHETDRRLRALAALRPPLCPLRDRIGPTTGARREAAAGSAGRLTGERREILRCADGRRSARDIAFRLGRGLYAVTVELSRLLAEGLVEVVPHGPAPAGPGALPAPVGGTGVTTARRPPDPPPAYQPAGRLPVRRRGASGINDVLAWRSAAGRHRRARDS